MPYSPTLSAETSTGGKLVTILLNLEQNASSQREAHVDGGIHLHAFVDFGPECKFHSRRSDVFDVGGFHPNISPTHSTPQSGFDYACKDGDIVAGGLGRPKGSVGTRTNADWSTIVAAPTRDEFLQLSWNNLHELCAPHSLLWRSTLIGDIGLIRAVSA